MTDTLWLKFDDDMPLPPGLAEEQKKKLETIFNAADPASLWSLAARQTGLKDMRDPLLKFYKGHAYLNWTAVTSLVTFGWIGVIPDEKYGYQYKLKGRLSNFLSFLKSQWRLSQYFMRRIDIDLPETPDGKIVESLALGFALLMLRLRLPAHDEKKLADWLAYPDGLQPSVKRTLAQIRNIRKRRALLGPALQTCFLSNSADSNESGERSPAFFWNEEQKTL